MKAKMGIKVNQKQFDHMKDFFYQLSGGEPVPVHNADGTVTYYTPEDKKKSKEKK
jgi:hypothetical protein